MCIYMHNNAENELKVWGMKVLDNNINGQRHYVLTKM